MVGRDRRSGEKGLGEVRIGVEIGRSGGGTGSSGEGQGEEKKDRERWGRTGRDRER